MSGKLEDEWQTGYVKTSDNPSDVLTKTIINCMDTKRKIRMMLYDIYLEDED